MVMLGWCYLRKEGSSGDVRMALLKERGEC